MKSQFFHTTKLTQINLKLLLILMGIKPQMIKSTSLLSNQVKRRSLRHKSWLK